MVEGKEMNIEDFKKKEIVYRFKKNIVVEYSKWLNDNDYSLRTSKEYCRHIKKLVGSPQKISIERIKKYLSDKKRKNTLSYSSIRLFIAFLDEVYEMRLPNFSYPRYKKETKIKPPAPTIEEIKLIIGGFKKDMIDNGRCYDYTLFIETMFRLGARIQEMIKVKSLNINWKFWIDNNKEWGKIAFTKTKGNKSRVIPVPKDLMLKLYKHLIDRDGSLKNNNLLLFDFDFAKYKRKKIKKWEKEKNSLSNGDERSQNYLLLLYVKKCQNDIQRRLKEISKKVLGREMRTHYLRSARATDLDIKGVGVSKIRDFLGHSNISTTSGYIRNKPEMLERELIEKDSF